MKKEFTAWQRTVLAHPHDVDITDDPDAVCMHLPARGRSVMLTCDIRYRNRSGIWWTGVARLGLAAEPAAAEAVLSGVGEGELFVEPSVHSKILHLRRRMTTEEMKQLGGTGL